MKKADVLSEIKRYPSYDFYEVWLDYLEELDEIFIETLLDLYANKLIFLFRRKNLESPKLSLHMRQKIMYLFANKNVLLDLDISQTEELSFIKRKKLPIQLLCSYHNYKETPGEKTLMNILAIMQEQNPTIYKLATFCNSEYDAIHLMKLLLQVKSQKQQYIILGMGKFGTITRIAGALWGNEINFTPHTNKESSAPGQLTKPVLKKILSLLSTKN